MSQERIQDYGSPVTASSIKTLVNAITSYRSAILSGNEFIADAANRLRINPGISVTHEGIIIIETEPKLITINNTSLAVDYTVYYYHKDAEVSGGVAAVLTMDTGLLSSVEGVILGYIRYPGGSVPLSNPILYNHLICK